MNAITRPVTSGRATSAPGAASPFGRAVLLADGLFCVALGAGVAAGASPLASVLGVGPAPVLAGLGVVFAGWGGFLLWRAKPRPAPRWLVGLVLAANLAWVGASALLLAGGLLGLSASGTWAVAGLAVAVAVFAGLLWRSLRGG